MAERPGEGVAHAIRAGLARTASAPAVLAGTLALTFVVALRPAHSMSDVLTAHLDSAFTAWVHGMGPVTLKPWLFDESSQAWFRNLPAALTWILFWSFLSGGVLDRYARNRAIRGRGFFGACAGHFPAMLRLGILAFLIHGFVSLRVAPALPANVYAQAGVVAALFGVGLLMTYARVRVVVEDRRSAIGALLAAGRFVRRNPAGAVVHAFYSLLTTGVLLPLGLPAPLDLALGEAVVAVKLFLILASCASATALFQTRLAHASYTAAPPIEWPESPAAEAITNLSPSTPA